MSGMAQLSLTLRGSALAVEAGRSIRIHLTPGEVCGLARGLGSVHVISGTAWISHRGRDILLASGERALIAQRRGDVALLSGLECKPLLVELGV